MRDKPASSNYSIQEINASPKIKKLKDDKEISFKSNIRHLNSTSTMSTLSTFYKKQPN